MQFSDMVRELMLVESFMAHYLLGLRKEWSDRIPTAAVTIANINPVMMFNKEFMDGLSEDHQVGVMWHEVSHIVQFHVCPSFYNMFEDKQLLNVAEDIHINQYIPVKYRPPMALMPETFPEIKLPTFQDTRTYYDLLKQNQDSNNPDPTLKSLLDFFKTGEPHRYDHSPHWENTNGDLGDLFENQIKNHIKRTFEEFCGSDPGNVPEHLRGMLEKLYAKTKPVTDWKAALRRFGTRSQKTTTKSTRNRPNKRYPDASAIRIKPKKKMAVAIDTSGSVSDYELALFFDQIEHIMKVGTEIEIIECDAAIGRIYSYKNRDQLGKITGGGGTCAQPVLDLINKDQKYNSVVYFTDGGLYDSQKRKSLKPVLWIITPNGTTDFNFDGPKIKMQNIEN
jgi:predicted metal-dependent peptidase